MCRPASTLPSGEPSLTAASRIEGASCSILGPCRNWIIGATTPRSASMRFLSCTAISESNPNDDSGADVSSVPGAKPSTRAASTCK